MKRHLPPPTRLLNQCSVSVGSICRREFFVIAALAAALSCAPVNAHLITSPSIPKPAIEATVEFEWPTELDERPARLDETRFSTELAMARFGARPRPQFAAPQLDATASSQPFFVGAPFGEGGLIGFRFIDFGPYGQEFTRSELIDEKFGGFVPLADQFAVFGRSARFKANGAGSSSNGSAAGDGSSSAVGMQLSQESGNPFSYLKQQHLLGTGAAGGSGGGEGSMASFSESSSSGGEGFLPRGIFGIFPWGPLGWPAGFTPRPGLGPGGAGLFPFTPPLYACWDPCGPGVPTPILGWPIGIFNPIIGPIGPFGFPFPHLPHHHHHCHPPCIPEPSQLAMLATLIPGIGVIYRMRSLRRRKTAK